MKKKIFNFLRYLRYLFSSILSGALRTNYKQGIMCQEMGLKRIKLDPFRYNHLKIIQNSDSIDEDILVMVNYISNEKLVICSNNKLLIYFFFYVLKKKIILFTSKKLNLDKNIKYNIIIDKKEINSKTISNSFIIDDLKIFNDLKKNSNVTLLTRSNLNIKKFYTYKYYKGRLFKSISKNSYNYYLITKKKLLTSIKKKKISAFSSIKSLELFPFDLCYESILPHVDEFILGVDLASLNTKRKKLLNKYLSQTKFRKKIKLVYFDFKTDVYKKFKSQGRWIANINNYLLNYCSGQYCFYVQADEFNNQLNLRKKLKNAIDLRVDEINFYFFHYIFNLWTVRDPKKASYEKAIRFFKNENYLSIYDGYNFRKKENLIISRKIDSGFSIIHLSYILAGKTKLNSNFSKNDGLFHNLTTKKKWLKNIFPINARNISKNIYRYKYLNSANNILKASNKNKDILKNFI